MNNGRWATIVGNGYNSSLDESGTASLFIVYLDAPNEPADSNGILNDGNGDYTIITASEDSWFHCADKGSICTLPVDMRVRYGDEGDYSYSNTPLNAGDHTCDESLLGSTFTGESATCAYSDSNGLSRPEIVDLDGNGTIDRVYAGDLHGNMWVFDLEADGDKGAASWTLHENQTKPLFTACADPDENVENFIDGVCAYESRQPITSTPLVRNNPVESLSSDNKPNKIVFFGTGQYLTASDTGSKLSQSFYTVWDAGSDSVGLSKSNLQPQEIDPILGGDKRLIISSPVHYDASSPKKMGWYYVTLPGSGAGSAERVTLKPLLFSNILIFLTLIPNDGLCNANAGSGYIMAVDALTGGNPPVDILGTYGSNNVAGIKITSVSVGASVTGTGTGGGVDLKIKTADGKEISTSLTPDDDDDGGGPGKLFKEKGRKSWSIIR
jgi:type IV pilus assembly protein PilY1